jgi:O-antigen ligase
MERAARWLPPAIALLVPTLFIPVSIDAFVLPRASLALAGGGLLAAAGLVTGRCSLGPLRLPVLAVAVTALAAAALSIAPAVSLVGTYARYESLPMRLAYLGLFCGAAWIGERDRTVAAFLIGCAVAAVETLYQAWSHSPPRPDGNLGQPNLLGALLAMAIPLALDRARTAGRPGGRGWLALASLCGVALVVSKSRSGWLGALAGVSVLAVFAVTPRWRRVAVPGAAMVLALAAGLVVFSPLRSLNEDTGAARLGVWRDSLSVIAERPLLGWGEDTMGLVYGRHQTADWEPGHNFDRAHSMPLDLAATQGVLGLAACAWLFGAWWLGVWRRRDLQGVAGVAGAACAYLAWSLLNFDWAPATAAVWLLAGAAWPATEAAAARRPHADPPARKDGRRTVLAMLAAAAGLAFAVPPMTADLAYYAGSPDRAAALDPLQPRYQAARGDLAGLRRAGALGDPDPSTYVALGVAEAQAGHPEAAVLAYRRALERYPYDTDARQRLASAAPAAAIASRRAASG